MSNTNNLENSKENTSLIIEKLLKQEQKEHPWEEIKIIEIKSWIYWVEFDTWNVAYYLNNDWEVISSYSWERSNQDYNKLLNQLWYREEKVWTRYLRYRLSDNSLVDKYSLEHFHIPNSIHFLDSLKYIDEAINSKNRLSRNQALELIPTFISAWSLKINELENFLNRWSITKEDFNNFLIKMIPLLKEQTIDERWNMKKIWKEITEEEIKDYFTKWYINKNQAVELYEIIKKRDERNEKIEEIKKQTISNLEQEKSEFNV